MEMEAAALFAVAEVRGLQVASAFTISDSLADLVWNPQFHGPEVEAGLIALYDAALSALLADPGRDAGSVLKRLQLPRRAASANQRTSLAIRAAGTASRVIAKTDAPISLATGPRLANSAAAITTGTARISVHAVQSRCHRRCTLRDVPARGRRGAALGHVVTAGAPSGTTAPAPS